MKRHHNSKMDIETEGELFKDVVFRGVPFRQAGIKYDTSTQQAIEIVKAWAKKGFARAFPLLDKDRQKQEQKERETTLSVLRKCGWSRKQAREELGLSKGALNHRIVKYDLMTEKDK